MNPVLNKGDIQNVLHRGLELRTSDLQHNLNSILQVILYSLFMHVLGLIERLQSISMVFLMHKKDILRHYNAFIIPYKDVVISSE